MQGEERLVIAAPAAAIYRLVSDVTRMGEGSPETRSVEWIEGAPGAVGSKFAGTNEAGGTTWTTVCTVTEAEPGLSFCFVVGKPEGGSTRWMFSFRPMASMETQVTERFEREWLPSEWGFRAMLGSVPHEEAAVLVRDRERTLREGIRTTLERIRVAAEIEDATRPA